MFPRWVLLTIIDFLRHYIETKKKLKFTLIKPLPYMRSMPQIFFFFSCFPLFFLNDSTLVQFLAIWKNAQYSIACSSWARFLHRQKIISNQSWCKKFSNFEIKFQLKKKYTFHCLVWINRRYIETDKCRSQSHSHHLKFETLPKKFSENNNG